MDLDLLEELVLRTPKRYRWKFNVALMACTVNELPTLQAWLENHGVVTGDWRRSAIWSRIKELRASKKQGPGNRERGPGG